MIAPVPVLDTRAILAAVDAQVGAGGGAAAVAPPVSVVTSRTSTAATPSLTAPTESKPPTTPSPSPSSVSSPHPTSTTPAAPTTSSSSPTPTPSSSPPAESTTPPTTPPATQPPPDTSTSSSSADNNPTTDNTPPPATDIDTDPGSLTETSASSSATGTGIPNAGASAGGFSFTGSTFIGIIVGGAVFILLIVGICWFIARQRRRRRRSALEDDVLGPGIDWRRRSQRLSRSGWRRSLDPEPKDQRILSPPPDVTPYPLPNRRPHEITHGEARDSVRMQYPLNTVAPGASRGELFVPPSRVPNNYQHSDRSSMWADGSEVDMYANDGSTIARTISTVTVPNSEYNLENDPGATFHTAQRVYPNAMPVHSPEGTFVSSHSGGTFGGTFPGSNGPFNAMAYPPSQHGTYHSATAHTAQGFIVPVGGSSTYVSNPAMSPASSHNPAARPLRPSFYEVRDAQVVPVGAPGQMHPQQQQQQYIPPPQSPPHQRIPAPRLLVDTKQPIIWNEDPLSTPSTTAGPSSSQWASQSSASLVRNAAPPAAGTPATPVDPRAQAVMSPTMGQPGGSFATQTRPLVASRTADLPYSTIEPGPAPGDPAVLAAVAGATTTTSPVEQGASLSRGQTIVRHADAGAFEDAVPEAEGGELHLPPAYGDIFGPPEPPRRQP